MLRKHLKLAFSRKKITSTQSERSQMTFKSDIFWTGIYKDDSGMTFYLQQDIGGKELKYKLCYTFN